MLVERRPKMTMMVLGDAESKYAVGFFFFFFVLYFFSEDPEDPPAPPPFMSSATVSGVSSIPAALSSLKS